MELLGAVDAGPCWSLSCRDLLCFALQKSPVIAVVDRGKQLRTKGISGSDGVLKFGIYQCTCEGCHCLCIAQGSVFQAEGVSSLGSGTQSCSVSVCSRLLQSRAA